MFEPTVEQIEQAREVAKKVAEWRRAQPDLIECPSKRAVITARTCQVLQRRMEHRPQCIDYGDITKAAMLLHCKGCERYKEKNDAISTST